MAAYIKWFEIAAALFALLRWHQLKKDIFLRHLAIVIFFIAAAELIGYAIKFYNIYNALYYNLFVEPVLFSLYGLAFYRGFINLKFRKVACLGAIIVVLIYYSTLTIFDPTLFLNIVGYDLGALFIGGLAICKIAEIIKYSEQPDYFKSPLIYLLLFIILYYLTTIPHFTVSFYFYFNNINNRATIFLNYVNTIFNYALYIAFAITFLVWEKKKQ